MQLNLSKNRNLLLEKIKESFISVLKIALIVILISVILIPIESGILLSFLFGCVLVIIGIAFFSIGVDSSMTKIGEFVGESTIKTKKLYFVIPVFFLVGLFITISEPDLYVLASYLQGSINSWIIIAVIGSGVGFYLVIAFLRILFKVKFKYLIALSYTIIFILSFFTPETFFPLAFDFGGVTTGPISVPFLIAIGAGIVSIYSNSDTDSFDEFGFTAICSIGPIIAIMVLGIIYKVEFINVTETQFYNFTDSQSLFSHFLSVLPKMLSDVCIAMLPIIFLFFAFKLKFKVAEINTLKILIGLLYTYVGLVLFLTGVNVGFSAIGNYIGNKIGLLKNRWLIVPLGILIGYFVVSCEPAVGVLCKQVNEITLGSISEKALKICINCGVALSVGLALLRILFYIKLYFIIIPLYLLAIILAFIVPQKFIAIAFDSGGVASGALTTSFILPLALGFCNSVKGNLAIDGFGVISLVAVTPIVSIEIFGLIYKLKVKKINKKKNFMDKLSESIIE